MATAYVRYVDVNADAGGNGTTSELTGANCAFKSLSLAEAAGGGAGQPPLNLTTAGDSYTIICQSAHASHTADTALCYVLGWTTSATSLITIQAAAESKAGLKWDATKYRLQNADVALYLGQNAHLDIDGLQLSGAGTRTLMLKGAAPGRTIVRNCHVRNLNATPDAGSSALYVFASGVLIAINSVFISKAIGTTPETCAAFFYGASANVYSCTFIGGYHAFWNNNANPGGVTLKNCYAGGSVGSNIASADGGTISLTKVATEDTTGSADLQSIPYTVATFVDPTYSAEDLHLAAASALRGKAASTVAESAPYNFTTDLDGQTRVAWDIGADECDFAAASSGGSFILRGPGPAFFRRLQRGAR